jgi:thymidylate kinase
MAFLAFEGVDGSGKTTLAQAVAGRIKGVYYKCPPKILLPLKPEIDQNGTPHESFLFYSLGNRIASREIDALLKTGDVCCDRYIYSTIAAHSVLLGRDLAIEGGICHPGYVVYSTAAWSVIERRLKAKGENGKYHGLKFLKESAKKYDELFASRTDVIRVDTSDTPVEEIVEQICSYAMLGKL